jgi:hypothetical protein
MSSQVTQSASLASARFQDLPVSLRVKLSGLWASLLFVFAYVDLFSLYREDVRSKLEAGQVSSFDVSQTFLLATTVYIAIPSLMVFLVLVLRPQVNRIANIVMAAVYALTIVGGAIGEWGYYVFGSALEVGLLTAIVFYAWTWPRQT